MDDQQEATRGSAAQIAQGAALLGEIAEALNDLDGIQIITTEVRTYAREVYLHAWSGADPHLVAERLGLTETHRETSPGGLHIHVKWQGARRSWTVTVGAAYDAEAVAS